MRIDIRNPHRTVYKLREIKAQSHFTHFSPSMVGHLVWAQPLLMVVKIPQDDRCVTTPALVRRLAEMVTQASCLLVSTMQTVDTGVQDLLLASVYQEPQSIYY